MHFYDICYVYIMSMKFIYANEEMVMKFNLFIVIFCTIITIFSMFLAGCSYVNLYSASDIETKISPDDKYEIIFQNVGLPDFPFGYSHAKIILKEGNKIITKQRFDVANDGVALVPGNWEVTWQQDCVQVVIKGSEQHKILYTFYYDGGIDCETLAELGINYNVSVSEKPEIVQETLSLEEQRILDGLIKIYEMIAADTGVDENDITYTAKCIPKIVISEDSYILYDRESRNGKCALYVLYQEDNDGESASEPEIVEMYAYEYDSERIIIADRHSWSDAGTYEYQTVTGE